MAVQESQFADILQCVRSLHPSAVRRSFAEGVGQGGTGSFQEPYAMRKALAALAVCLTVTAPTIAQPGDGPDP